MSDSDCILVTGFEPFGGDPDNPSADLARRMDGRVIAGHPVVGRVLPVEFEAAPERLLHYVAELNPVFTICTGLAADRRCLSIERIAINLADARIADNAGYQPQDVPVRRDGPAALWSTLPVREIYSAWMAAGLRCEFSTTAGAYVCNTVFYRLMYSLANDSDARGRGGFIHFPRLAADEILRGMEIAIETTLKSDWRR